MTPHIDVKPSREEHKVRLTTFESEVAKALSSKQNRAFADVLSEAIRIGLDVLVERDNRVNIWRKTSLKGAIANLLDGLSPEELQNVIETLKAQKED